MKRRYEPELGPDVGEPFKTLDEIACETAQAIIDFGVKLEHPGAHPLLRGLILGGSMKAIAAVDKLREERVNLTKPGPGRD